MTIEINTLELSDTEPSLVEKVGEAIIGKFEDQLWKTEIEPIDGVDTIILSQVRKAGSGSRVGGITSEEAISMPQKETQAPIVWRYKIWDWKKVLDSSVGQTTTEVLEMGRNGVLIYRKILPGGIQTEIAGKPADIIQNPVVKEALKRSHERIKSAKKPRRR